MYASHGHHAPRGAAYLGYSWSHAASLVRLRLLEMPAISCQHQPAALSRTARTFCGVLAVVGDWVLSGVAGEVGQRAESAEVQNWRQPWVPNPTTAGQPQRQGLTRQGLVGPLLPYCAQPCPG